MTREFRSPDHFATGAIGPPGQRVFYLQAGDHGDLVAVKMEKQQVQALAQFLQTVLDDLPDPIGALPSADLIEPVQPDFVIGQIAVGVDEADGQIVLVLEELTDESEDGPVEVDPLGLESMGATARLHISSAQARAFVDQAESLMNKGRPPCPLCGQPEDPAGHACPRLN